ncbi:hypothetical protein V7S43_011053 [Phytophthora oleae]|uniref:DUF676 domain-containing protein n=1 Tax=Phytophthora oleae TaxID=2107226 RepID=A0ABD3FBB9_9STRA
MFHSPLLLALTACAASLASAASDLPVIFIHGVLGNYEDGDNFVANLTAQGRTAVSLKFCDDSCSIESLVTQVPLAVQTVRDVVANNSAFDDGYMIVAHSQGGAVSRAVIEEMDDHKVKRYVSMAGIQNGIFTGPYEVDASAAAGYGFLTALVPEEVFNYTKYAPEDFYGKLQHDPRSSTSRTQTHSTRTRSSVWPVGRSSAVG